MPPRTQNIRKQYSVGKWHQRVLAQPDVYCGQIAPGLCMFHSAEIAEHGWIISHGPMLVSECMIQVFVEIWMNACDSIRNAMRSAKPVDRLILHITPVEIRVANICGDFIDVGYSDDPDAEGVLIPTFLFGNPLSSSHYSETENKSTGKNGYGAKLTNAFSKRFSVSCYDPERSLLFEQTWSENTCSVTEPNISRGYTNAELDAKQCGRVDVVYQLDFERFGRSSSTGYTENEMGVIIHHGFSAAIGCGIPVEISVSKQDGETASHEIRFQSSDILGRLREYMVLSERSKSPQNFDVSDTTKIPTIECSGVLPPSERFGEVQYAVILVESAVDAANNTCATVHTYVNGQFTPRGIHLDAMLHDVGVHAQRTFSFPSAVSADELLPHLSIYAFLEVVNPRWKSNTKLHLTEPRIPPIPWSSDDILKLFSAPFTLGNSLIALREVKERLVHARTDGKKRAVVNLDALDDAHLAGDKHRSHETILGLAEGTSATIGGKKITGMSGLGNQNVGILTIFGKPPDVMEATAAEINQSKIFSNLKTALGLRHGCTYATAEERATLRYGRCLFMLDFDQDGHHIRGLLLLYFFKFYPALIQCGYVLDYRTPMYRLFPIASSSSSSAISRRNAIACYSQSELNGWRKRLISEHRSDAAQAAGPNRQIEDDLWFDAHWEVRQYKGLASSNKDDIEEDLFSQRTLTRFHIEDGVSESYFRMFFHSKYVSQRLHWIISGMQHQSFLKDAEDEIRICEEERTRGGNSISTSTDKNVLELLVETPIEDDNVLAPAAGEPRDTGFISVESIPAFFETKLLPFSVELFHRLVPSIADGFIPSTRKLVWTAMNMPPNRSCSVPYLSNKAANDTGYEHGDGLTDCLLKMLRDFPGGNMVNLPLFVAEGQVSSRGAYPKMSKARYISVRPDRAMMDVLFPREDYEFLTYSRYHDSQFGTMMVEKSDSDAGNMAEEPDDDSLATKKIGSSLSGSKAKKKSLENKEPTHLLPIFPLCLANGLIGIPKGLRTMIPSFHPLDIIAALRQLLTHHRRSKSSSSSEHDCETGKLEPFYLLPWVRNFRGMFRPMFPSKQARKRLNGQISTKLQADVNGFLCYGTYSVDDRRKSAVIRRRAVHAGENLSHSESSLDIPIDCGGGSGSRGGIQQHSVSTAVARKRKRADLSSISRRSVKRPRSSTATDTNGTAANSGSSSGCGHMVCSTITELPCGRYTDEYIRGVLIPLKKSGIVDHFENESVENEVLIRVYTRDVIPSYEMLQLVTRFSATSMYILVPRATSSDATGMSTTIAAPHRFTSVIEILQTFIEFRLPTYAKRRARRMDRLRKEYQAVCLRRRLICDVVDKKLIITGHNRQSLENQLLDLDYVVSDAMAILKKMSMVSTIEDEIDRLELAVAETKQQLDALETMSPADLWLDDLTIFEEFYQKRFPADKNMESSGPHGLMRFREEDNPYVGDASEIADITDLLQTEN